MSVFSNLNSEIKKCELCALSKTRKQVVPGDGVSKIRILFVGEAPGKKEDELGIPFCGAAGKFLAEMMSDNNFSREDELGKEGIYITNIVKCRPPENRDPEEKEKEICSKHLDRQIKALKPKLIVTLGRHSMWHFLPNFKISQAHGQVYCRKDGIHIMPLYHPAAALYNGSMRSVHKHDFRKIRKFLEQLKKEAK